MRLIHTDTQGSVQALLGPAPAESLISLVTEQLTKFVASEAVFAGQEESTVISQLAKTNKDNLAVVVPQV